MKTNGTDRTLESFKIFPVISWIIVISFAYFVYGIAERLQVVTFELEDRAQWLQEQVDTPPEQIKDFEKSTSTVKKK